MSDGTSIEWAEASLTPIRARNNETGKVGWYCTHASPGCGDSTGGGCYAESMNRRLGTGIDYRAQDRGKVEIFLDEKMLMQPLRWKRGRRIFWNSMTDTFADFVPDEWLDRIFAVCALTPQHQHLVLTKRAERMRDYLGDPSFGIRLGGELMKAARGNVGAECLVIDLAHRLSVERKPLPNVWAGVSVEDQRRADERIPHLLATPAAVRWISAEPLLGPVELSRLREGTYDAITGCGDFERLDDWGSRPNPRFDWVVCGGESGPGARPMHPSWARSLRDQCQAAGVAFFFKQWGEFAPVGYPDGLADRPEEHLWLRVGKKAAGRLLDGREWSEYPEPHQ